MLHTLLNVLLSIIAFAILTAIAVVSAGECSLRAKQRRDGANVVTDEIPPVPRICLHPNETLSREYAAKVAFICLDCGETRIIGEVWFGASNRKAKRPAA